jgi:hypothetical protein
LRSNPRWLSGGERLSFPHLPVPSLELRFRYQESDLAVSGTALGAFLGPNFTCITSIPRLRAHRPRLMNSYSSFRTSAKMPPPLYSFLQLLSDGYFIPSPQTPQPQDLPPLQPCITRLLGTWPLSSAPILPL